MANIQLSLICSDNDRTRPIIDGTIKPDGIDWTVTVAHPSEIFWRQLHHAEFDISEMSMSSLLMATAHGDERWVGLPVFTSRRFFHTGVLVRNDRGIDSPADLKGKKMGVPEYQQTAALWSRAALQHVYGVAAQDMDWYMERNPEMSHGGATGFNPPPGVKLQYIPVEENIGTYMQSGEIDATLLYIRGGNLVDRSTADLDKDPHVRRLFPDARAEGISYYQKTGFYPINHGMVVKREVYEKHPWVPINIFNAMQKAKDMVNARAKELAAPYAELGMVGGDQARALSSFDPFPYGVVANRDILGAIAQFSHEQGLTPRVLSLDEVFVPDAMEL